MQERRYEERTYDRRYCWSKNDDDENGIEEKKKKKKKKKNVAILRRQREVACKLESSKNELE
jgi:hypothetical protein